MVILPVATNSSWTMKTESPGEANYVSEQSWEKHRPFTPSTSHCQCRKARFRFPAKQWFAGLQDLQDLQNDLSYHPHDIQPYLL